MPIASGRAASALAILSLLRPDAFVDAASSDADIVGPPNALRASLEALFQCRLPVDACASAAL